jgi:hypothetical protein
VTLTAVIGATAPHELVLRRPRRSNGATPSPASLNREFSSSNTTYTATLP